MAALVRLLEPVVRIPLRRQWTRRSVQDGVFGWNGLLAFWMVADLFGTWFLVLTWQLLATIGKADAVDARQGVDAGPVFNSY